MIEFKISLGVLSSSVKVPFLVKSENIRFKQVRPRTSLELFEASSGWVSFFRTNDQVE